VKILYGAIGLVVPFIMTLVFMFYAGKKYFSIDEDLRYSARTREFPDDISEYSVFLKILYFRKLSIYYPLIFINFLLFFFFPKIGGIFNSICILLFIFFCIGQQKAVSICKRALRGLDSHNRLLYAPLLSLYRSSFLYTVLLLFCFSLFFEVFY